MSIMQIILIIAINNPWLLLIHQCSYYLPKSVYTFFFSFGCLVTCVITSGHPVCLPISVSRAGACLSR